MFNTDSNTTKTVLFNAKKMRENKSEPKMKISYHGGNGMNNTGEIWIKLKDGTFLCKKDLEKRNTDL